MKRLIALMMATMTMASASAQEELRLLTMEEAVLGTGLTVENLHCTWRADGAIYTVVEGDSLYAVEPKSGKKELLTTLERLNRVAGTDLKRIPAHRLTRRGTMRFEAGRYLIGIDPKADTLVHKYAAPEGAENAVYADEGRFLYNRANNLYWSDRSGVEHPITEYTDKNMVCGQVVSRNEFGITKGTFVSPDLMKVAFYRKDESQVASFPLLDVTTRTGSLVEIKYPMAGMPSERVALDVYDFETGKTVRIKAVDFDKERYLTNIAWGPASDKIYIQVLDRA